MCVTIDTGDIDGILEVMEKYPKDGLNACLSFVVQQPPIKPHQTHEFIAAIEYIESLSIEDVWSRDHN